MKSKNEACLKPFFNNIECRCEYKVFTDFPVILDSDLILIPEQKEQSRNRSVGVRFIGITRLTPSVAPIIPLKALRRTRKF